MAGGPHGIHSWEWNVLRLWEHCLIIPNASLLTGYSVRNPPETHPHKQGCYTPGVLFGHIQQNNGTRAGRFWVGTGKRRGGCGLGQGLGAKGVGGGTGSAPALSSLHCALGRPSPQPVHAQDPRGPSSQAGVIQSPPMIHKRGIHWLLCPASASSPTCQRQAPVALPPAIQPRRSLRVPRTHRRLPPGAWPLQLSEGSEQRHPHSPLPVTQ